MAKLDVALIGQEGAAAAREFHSASCARSVCVRRWRTAIALLRVEFCDQDLKGRDFIGIDEDEMPGRNRWMTSLCKTAGFKPRFVATVDGLTNVMSHIVSESAVTSRPPTLPSPRIPVCLFVPLSEAKAKWDFIVLWQKGGLSAAGGALVSTLSRWRTIHDAVREYCSSDGSAPHMHLHAKWARIAIRVNKSAVWALLMELL